MFLPAKASRAVNAHYQAIIDMLKEKYNYTEEYSGEVYYTRLMAVSVKLEKESLYRSRVVVITSYSDYCDGMEQIIAVVYDGEDCRADFYDPEWYECTAG